jgi:Mg-chelatase subunit ChlD
MKKTSRRIFIGLLLFAFFVHGTVAVAPVPQDESQLKLLMSDFLTKFLNQFDNTDFKDLVKLGERSTFISHLNAMTVELDRTFDKQGKYYPRVAGLQYVMNDKMKVNAIGKAATKTLWHEMIHRLVFRVGGGAPCAEEEAYTYLCEDRESWLNQVRSFETTYKNGKYTAAMMKTGWEKLEARWNNYAGFNTSSNLSGPYSNQDPDNTCGSGGATRTEISAAFIQKWDRVVGIQIDLAKLREFFKPKISYLEKTEEVERTLTACDYTKVTRLLDELANQVPKDDFMIKWEADKMPMLKQRAQAVVNARSSLQAAKAAEARNDLDTAISELQKALYVPGFPDCLRKEITEMKSKLERRKRFGELSKDVERATSECDYQRARQGIEEIARLTPLEQMMEDWRKASQTELQRLEENARKAIALLNQAEAQTSQAEAAANANPPDENRVHQLAQQAAQALTQADKIAPKCLRERQKMEAIRLHLDALAKRKKPVIKTSIILLIDTSGSMADNNKINQAKDAAKRAARQVSQTTEIAILNFDGGCGGGAMRVAAQFTTDLNTLIAAIDKLQPGGGTPMYIATAEAVTHAQKHGRGTQRTVVLMSDGGDSCRDQQAQAAASIRSSNISVSTIGFDVGNNQQAQGDLGNLATMTGGRTFSASAADPREIIRAFNLAMLPSLLKDFDFSNAGNAVAGYFSQAKAMVQQQNIGGALMMLQQANQIAPNSPNLNFNLSLLYESEDQLIPAMNHANNYLKLAPQAIDRTDVENRITEMQKELQRNPRVVMDSSGCRDVLAWAQTEQDAAKRGRDVARRQGVLEILIAAQRGECEKARSLQAGYRQRFQ